MNDNENNARSRDRVSQLEHTLDVLERTVCALIKHVAQLEQKLNVLERAMSAPNNDATK